MVFTEQDIHSWIKKWEGQTLDFKSKDILDHPNDLVELMVAFGNNKESEHFGGRMIIGVNNQTREIESFSVKEGHELHIMNIARDKCYPSINLKFEIVKCEHNQVYVITIPKMNNIPYQVITKNGKTHRIRVGSTIREPTSHELEKLYEKNNTKVVPKSQKVTEVVSLIGQKRLSILLQQSKILSIELNDKKNARVGSR